MANYTASISTHQTAASGVADTVTLASDFGYVEVLARVNAGGTQFPIYFTVDGVGGPAGDGVPTLAGKDTYVVPALSGASLRVPSRSQAATVVRLIAGGAQDYTVQGVND